jgi:hypothetical protein
MSSSAKKGRKVTTRAARADCEPDQDNWEIQAEGEESGTSAACTSSDEERDAKICALDGCIRPVFVDTSTGRVHDYCGKNHARQAGALGDAAAANEEMVAQLLARISALEQQSVLQPPQAATGDEQDTDVLYNGGSMGGARGGPGSGGRGVVCSAPLRMARLAADVDEGHANLGGLHPVDRYQVFDTVRRPLLCGLGVSSRCAPGARDHRRARS